MRIPRFLALVVALPLTGVCGLMGGACSKSEADCDEESRAAEQYVEAVRASYLSCQVDNDCVLVSTGTECQGGCGAAVGRAGLEKVNAAVAEANQKWCGDRAECGQVSSNCRSATPACTQAKCVTVWK